ncbi:helix-turn-helix domain-containing protein [Secundilactobacillus kimchicus]|nr:helix-turn-helix transcriptional regulator [Secundilactobacillus kimchicus]MBT9670889.1 helix-turn-helix domain-containing protein [Secundilactobacillus kimchicus]
MQERLWLKEYRRLHNLSQDQMANILDIPKSTYTSYESGWRTPNVDKAKDLSLKMGVEWTIFFEKEVRDLSMSGKKVNH